MDEKIDFVITWVDGNDSQWQKKRNRYLNNNNSKVASFNGNGSTVRFRDYGTLKFVFRSIDKFAPWVNKIFLVTDNQKPKWLDTKNPKVEVIDHTQIVNSKYLPLFNSNSIEWNIDNIPNLSEQFVYFNDDMILNKKVEKEDFFKNGLPCDYRVYKDIVPTEDFDHIPVTNDILINNYLNGKWPLNKTGLYCFKYGIKWIKGFPFLLQAYKGKVPGYSEPHGPLSFKKSSFKKAKSIWKKEINENYTHRFRQMDDISIWLVRHLQLEDGMFNPSKANLNKTYTVSQLEEMKSAFRKSEFRSICINDENTNDFNVKAKAINKILTAKFPTISSFEKGKN
ncbi:stealth family protein [Lactobacillus sp. UMNPBX4]|uniref:stealth family protein n=1 Tax=Lactobacillus sp. UMNPBX4 TaxID=2042043 RepID=UPI000BEEBB11|nr:stealth family protein [Lactobacillus sp. UMNPBX4]PEH05975.1 capsule biosynthesis protein CapC [Lactobacillus sp. UMNPBX4]